MCFAGAVRLDQAGQLGISTVKYHVNSILINVADNSRDGKFIVTVGVVS
jgi:hypothetical protein